MEDVFSCPKAPVPDDGALLLKGEETEVVLSILPNGESPLFAGSDSGDEVGDAGRFAGDVCFGVRGKSLSSGSSLTCIIPNAVCPAELAVLSLFSAPLPVTDLEAEANDSSNTPRLSTPAPKAELSSERCEGPKAPLFPLDAQTGLESSSLRGIADVNEEDPFWANAPKPPLIGCSGFT